MTLLSCLQQVADELSLPRPATVINNTDQTTRQMLALLTRSGQELRDQFEWSQLMRTYTLTTNAVSLTGSMVSGSSVVTGLASTASLLTNFKVSNAALPSNVFVRSIDSSTQVTLSQAATATVTSGTFVFGQDMYALPGDFDRPVLRTAWDRNYRWELQGPTPPQEWEWRKSGIVPSTPRRRFRVVGTTDYRFQIDPVPGASDGNQVLAFDYYSKSWIAPAAWAASTAYAAGRYCTYNGAIYRTTSGGTSGSNPPTTLSGSQSDGGVTWTYQTDAYESFLRDDDTMIWSEMLMALGTRWQFLKAKGLEWTTSHAEWLAMAAREANKQRSARTVQMVPRKVPLFLTAASVPDTGYGTASS